MNHLLKKSGFLLAAMSVALANVSAETGKTTEAKLKVGDKAPAFELLNQKGEKVSLAQYKGKKSIILAFSRAHW